MRITRRRSNGGQTRWQAQRLAARAVPHEAAPASAESAPVGPPQAACQLTPERRVRLRAEVGALDTISTPVVTELRTRLARNCYHPSAREVAARMLAEFTAELLS